MQQQHSTCISSQGLENCSPQPRLLCRYPKSLSAEQQKHTWYAVKDPDQSLELLQDEDVIVSKVSRHAALSKASCSQQGA